MAASSYRETPVTGSVQEEATEPGSKGRGLSLATQQALKVKMLDYAAKEQLGAPVRLQGEVVKGFGRGSKELGVPTANLPVETLGAELDGLNPGVYYGWASVDGEVPCKMVMSIGWNPFYGNKTKTVEPHLLAHFEEDFYGKQLKLVVTGYLRPEMNFDSLDALIAAIHSDIHAAYVALDEEGGSDDDFFVPSSA
ncbi:anon-84Ea [Symbiodinium sp. KB8]|nr:anon-84Ea [Symbiodinium sp. KB8]